MKQISAKQNICVFITFLISSIPMISGYTQAKQDIWLSYIIAFIAFVPLTLLYVRMCSLYPGKNLFEIFGETCGRKIGVVLSALYILYLLHIAGVSLRISSEFIHVISLTQTPQWVLLLSFFVLCAYGAYKGIYFTGHPADADRLLRIFFQPVRLVEHRTDLRGKFPGNSKLLLDSFCLSFRRTHRILFPFFRNETEKRKRIFPLYHHSIGLVPDADLHGCQ